MYQMRSKFQPLFCSPAAYEYCAACSEYGRTNWNGLNSIFSLPLRTYFWIRGGSTSSEYALQAGHTRSPYSTSVAGAFGSPRGPPLCGMPSNSCAARSWPATFSCADFVGPDAPPDEM